MAKNSKKSKSKGWDGDRKIIAVNRRARHDYTVEDTLETGIALLGTEVKSLREGKLSFKDSYAAIEDGELWLLNAHIDEYGPANRFNHEPERRRRWPPPEDRRRGGVHGGDPEPRRREPRLPPEVRDRGHHERDSLGPRAARAASKAGGRGGRGFSRPPEDHHLMHLLMR